MTEPLFLYLARPEHFDDAAGARCAELLDEAELKRCARFKFARHRHSFRVSHAMLRLALSLHHARAPKAWRFALGERGRPEIDDTPPPLRFNLSHTEGLIAIAIHPQSDGGALGVDVEDHTQRRNLRGIASRFFAETEYLPMLSMDDHAFRTRFFALWTLKESYIKARGAGLAIPLHQFAFDLDTPPHIRLTFQPELDDSAPERWRFARFTPTPEHSLAVAFRPRDTTAEPLSLQAAWIHLEGTQPLCLTPVASAGISGEKTHRKTL